MRHQSIMFPLCHSPLLTFFCLLQHGSHKPEHTRNSFSIHPPQAPAPPENVYLLWHEVLHRFQGNICFTVVFPTCSTGLECLLCFPHQGPWCPQDGFSPFFSLIPRWQAAFYPFLKLFLLEVLTCFADGGCTLWWVWSCIWHRAGLASPHRYWRPSLPTSGYLHPVHSTLTSVKHLLKNSQ